MLKIGEFARIAQVSVRMLRHYDKLGLLKPGFIDETTGYRYYSIEQLPRLHRLLALKDLGLSLEQVMRLLDEQVTDSEVRGMLRLKQAELRQELDDTALRLQQVEQRLVMLDEHGNQPPYDIVLKSVPTTYALTCERTMPPLTAEGFNAFFWEGSEAICRAGLHYQHVLALTHNPYFIFRRPYSDEWPFRFEAVYTVDSPNVPSIPLNGGNCLRLRTLEGCKLVASALHSGSDTTRHLAQYALCQWMEQHGYALESSIRVIYLRRGKDLYGDEHVTEIQYPIRKVDVRVHP